MEKPHRRLEVWQWSMDLTVMIYELTNAFPSHEKFGLVSQLRRAAVSIASKIAEGSARHSATDYARFLTMAIGSRSELDTQLELARRLGHCTNDSFREIDEKQASLNRMLIALRKSVQHSKTP